jgi:hypothetical protein
MSVREPKAKGVMIMILILAAATLGCSLYGYFHK